MTGRAIRFSQIVAVLSVLTCATVNFAQTNTTPIRGPLVATFEADRETIYAGEVFYLYFSVYSDGPELAQDMQLDGLPERDVLALEPFSSPLANETRTIGNRRQVKRHRVQALAPRPGRMVVAPSLRGTVLRRSSGFFSTLRFNHVQIPVVPTVLTILPIPTQGRPDDYSGVIGEVDFKVDVEPRNIAVGDLVTIRMRIQGKEELPELDAPTLSVDKHFKAYPTRALKVSSPRERRFEKTVVPLSTNAVAVGSVQFSYFAPRQHGYVTVKRGPFPLTYHAPEKLQRERPRVTSLPASLQEVVTINTDPMPYNGGAAKPAHDWLRSPVFWALQPVPLILYVGLSLIARKRDPIRLGHRGLPVVLLLPALPFLTFAVSLEGPAHHVHQAIVAHESEDYRGAVAIYETLIKEGNASAAIHYNLANAHYMLGQMGHAILNYSRAHRLAPRNGAIALNLERAAQIARVPLAPPPKWYRLASHEWLIVATCCYWLICLTAGIRKFTTRRHILLELIVVAAMLTGATALFGVWMWNSPSHRNGGTLVQDTTAHFGPMQNARVQYPLREGTFVEVLEPYREWVKIDAEGRRGWILRSTVERIE